MLCVPLFKWGFPKNTLYHSIQLTTSSQLSGVSNPSSRATNSQQWKVAIFCKCETIVQGNIEEKECKKLSKHCARGQLVLLYISTSVYLCIPTYHVHNNYVMYTVAMQPQGRIQEFKKGGSFKRMRAERTEKFRVTTPTFAKPRPF